MFHGYARILGEPFAFAVPPGRLVAGMVLVVVLPVLAGMVIRRRRPAWAGRLDRPLRAASLAGVVLLLVLVFATQGAQIRRAEWIGTATAALAFTGAALLAGLGFGRALRLDGRESFTVGLLFATRNVGLAMTIAVAMLGRLDYAVFAAVYFLAETPLLLGAAALFRRRFRSGQPLAGSDLVFRRAGSHRFSLHIPGNWGFALFIRIWCIIRRYRSGSAHEEREGNA